MSKDESKTLEVGDVVVSGSFEFHITKATQYDDKTAYHFKVEKDSKGTTDDMWLAAARIESLPRKEK